MKKLYVMRTSIITLIFVLLLSGVAFAGNTYARGQAQRDSTYAEPRYRTAPNDTRSNDNYSTKGNTDPSRPGRKGPDPYDKRYSNQYNRPSYGY